MKNLRLFFSIAFIALLLVLLSQPQARKQFVNALVSLSLSTLASVVTLFILMRLAQSISLQRALRIQDQTIGFDSSLTLVGLKGLFNLGFSGLGVAAQSAQGQIKHFVPIGAMVVANVIQLFLLIAALGLLLLIALALFWRNPNTPVPIVLVILGVVFAICGLGMGVACVSPKCTAFLRHRLPLQVRLGEHRRIGEQAPRAVFLILILQAACVLFRLGRVLIIAWGIDPHMDFQTLAISVLVADAIGVIPITPGGIGMRELMIGLIGAASRHYEVFLAAAVLDRIVMIALNFSHGAVAVSRSGR